MGFLFSYGNTAPAYPYEAPHRDDGIYLPRPREIAGSILSMGSQWATYRSLFYGARLLGTGNPFDARTPRLRYSMWANTGIMGDISRAAAWVGDWASLEETRTAGKGAGNWIRRTFPAYNPAYAQSLERKNLIYVQGGDRYAKGIVDRMLIRPSHLADQFRGVLGEHFDTIFGSDDAFTSDLYRHLRRAGSHDRRPIMRQLGYQVFGDINKDFRHLISPTTAWKRWKMNKRIDALRATIRDIHDDPAAVQRIRQRIRDERARFTGTRKLSFTMTAPETGAPVSDRYDYLLQRGIHQPPRQWPIQSNLLALPRRESSIGRTVRRISTRLRHPFSNQSALVAGQYASAVDAMIDRVRSRGTAIPDHEAALDALKRIRTSGANRMLGARTLGRLASWGGAAMITVDLAAKATSAALSGAVNTAMRVGATMRSAAVQDFGSGQSLWNSRIATERQRAIEAIQNSAVGARSILGNEAAMYH